MIDDLDPALIDFVRNDVPADRDHFANRLWFEYNLRRGYKGKLAVFREAILQAGMEQLPSGKLRKL